MPTNTTQSQEPAVISYLDAQLALMDICGGKAKDWLLDIYDGSMTYGSLTVNSIRRKILEDYMYNSFSAEGVESLRIVLLFLRQQFNLLEP